MATTLGAAIASRVYSSATAKWVGLVMTTVALGTAASMRRRDHLALHAADAALDLGVALEHLVLVLDFLLGHLQRLAQLVALEQVVRGGDRREARSGARLTSVSTVVPRRAGGVRQADAAQERRASRRSGWTTPQATHASAVATMRDAHEVEAGLRRHQPLEAVDRAQLAEVRLQRLPRHVPAALRRHRGERRRRPPSAMTGPTISASEPR